MSTQVIHNIVLIGSGNVATSLAVALRAANFAVKQIYSPTLLHAKQLADVVGADYANTPDKLYANADLYIIAVPDKEIENVLKTLCFGQAAVVHTSGSTPMRIFEGYLTNYGVLYPLQTFSKEKYIGNFNTIPVFIEAATPVSAALRQVAERLSAHVFEIDSKQRLALHVSAVWACNFVNHLLALATDIMRQNGLDKDWLAPLIHETIDKALAAKHPSEVQTGPAARHDMPTLERHMEFLAQQPQKAAIYKMLSESIMNYNDKSKYE